MSAKETLKRLLPALTTPCAQSVVLGYIKRPLYRASRFIRAGSAGERNVPVMEAFRVPGAEVFFGYHDLPPLHQDGQRILAHVVWPRSRSADAEIGFFRRDEQAFNRIARTEAWCWQMGSRLQWFPSADSELVLYNAFRQDRVVSVIQGLHGPIEHIVPRPAYAVQPGGRRFLSLNFSRLQKLRPGYGYKRGADPLLQENAPDHDGVWLVDVETGQGELIVSLRELAEYQLKGDAVSGLHYVNHLSFNPAGDQIFFIHIWVDSASAGRWRWRARGMTVTAEGRDLRPLCVSDIVSHFVWLDNDNIMIFCQPQHLPPAYYVYNTTRGLVGPADPQMPGEDGHPALSSDRRICVDTYPDKYGDQHLYIVTPGSNSRKKVARLRSGPRYFGEYRCDLHPRWGGTNSIIVDSTHGGRRGIYLVASDSQPSSPCP